MITKKELDNALELFCKKYDIELTLDSFHGHRLEHRGQPFLGNTRYTTKELYNMLWFYMDMGYSLESYNTTKVEFKLNIILNNNKIAALKRLRTEYNLRLKEAITMYNDIITKHNLDRPTI